MASQAIYQFHAELTDYRPKIWRRFEVMQNVSMARLGYIIMTLFEMQASHLFQFRVPEKSNFRLFYRDRIGFNEDPAWLKREERWIEESFSDDRVVMEVLTEESEVLPGQELVDAAERKLRSTLNHPGEELYFLYDFGDGWEVKLKLESIRRDPQLPGKDLPRVLEGEGYGIIEDCGGYAGLTELAKAFKREKGQHYREMKEWLGVDNLDLAAFDIDDMNLRLKNVPRIYADIYEYDLEPTRQSMKILQREYLKGSR